MASDSFHMWQKPIYILCHGKYPYPGTCDWRSINDDSVLCGQSNPPSSCYRPVQAGDVKRGCKRVELMFRDTYHRQWQVSVDGRPAELLRANINFSFAIPAGEHEIRFSFIPWPFVIALLLYVVSNVVFLGYALFRSLPNGFMTRIGSKPASGAGTK